MLFFNNSSCSFHFLLLLFLVYKFTISQLYGFSPMCYNSHVVFHLVLYVMWYVYDVRCLWHSSFHKFRRNFLALGIATYKLKFRVVRAGVTFTTQTPINNQMNWRYPVYIVAKIAPNQIQWKNDADLFYVPLMKSHRALPFQPPYSLMCKR